jgi:hypothetical protein
MPVFYVGNAEFAACYRLVALLHAVSLLLAGAVITPPE